MENKKNYVDGVDVSGCDSYSYNHNELMPYGDVKITEHYCYHVNRECNGKDCDYKQLKRLQAEYEDLHLSYAGCKTANTGLQELNDKLQAENDNLKDDIDKQQLYVDSLEQENERLKARLRPLENSYFNGLSSIEIAELAKKSIRITAENRKLEYALQEIREICKNSHTSASEDYYRTADKIQDKINEVIGVE